jgi:glyoxylase-like metal-dependent hydrolase (beta-lactamase superfamily II)
VYVQLAKEAISESGIDVLQTTGRAVTPVTRVTGAPEVTAVHFATARSRVAGYGVYVFMTRGTLIDTAFHAVRRELSALLGEMRPRGVLLTHQHEDHAGNAELVARRGIPIGAAVQTFAAIRSVDPIGLYRRFVWSSMPPLRAPVVPHAPAGLELIHAPGHSIDHHVIWDAERETLFAGDLFLGVKVRVARPGEDPRVLVRSLRAIARLDPRHMLDSHRGVIERPAEMLLAKADWLEETIGRIDHLHAAGRTESEILTLVMGGEAAISYVSAGDLSRRNFVRAVTR